MENTRFSTEQIQLEQSSFITKVYSWMAVALLITGLIAKWTVSTPELLSFIFDNRFVFWGLLIVEILCVGYLVTVINKISSLQATLIFIAYAALNGLTLSYIFVLFTAESIATTFFVTAGTFAVMSLYGYITKRDLTSMGNLARMALIGLIIATVVNIFVHNEMLYWITTYAGILIFVGLTAYDTQKIKEMSMAGNSDAEDYSKKSILGALTLYLDFINLFLLLLRLFGRRN